MGISQAATARDPSAKTNIEYIIYTFQRGAGPKGHERWHKHDSLNDMALALKKAESLFDSGDFCKVEIKQKYSDPRHNRVVDTTLKILERKAKKTISTQMMAVMAAFGGLLTFCLTYFFSIQS